MSVGFGSVWVRNRESILMVRGTEHPDLLGLVTCLPQGCGTTPNHS